MGRFVILDSVLCKVDIVFEMVDVFFNIYMNLIGNSNSLVEYSGAFSITSPAIGNHHSG